LLSASLPSCCRSHPAGVARRYGQFATIHVAFALRLRTQPPEKHSRGHLCVHFHYGPMARHHPKEDAVNRFQKFGFPPLCYSSYEAPDFCPGGFCHPTEQASLRWTHNRTCGFPASGFHSINPTFAIDRSLRDKYQVLQTVNTPEKEHPARMTSAHSVTFFREATHADFSIVANHTTLRPSDDRAPINVRIVASTFSCYRTGPDTLLPGFHHAP
jgi:hypothetical protein